MLQDQRLITAALTGYALLQMFPKVRLIDYQALGYGFSLQFAYKAKLDNQFLQLLGECLDGLLSQELTLYPMTMMGENAASLLRHQGQDLLGNHFSRKELVEMVKIQDSIVLPAPSAPWKPLFCKFLKIEEKEKGVWLLEAAAFEEKANVKEFLKLYSRRENFNPFALAVKKGLVTEQGLWREEGLTHLEEIRKSEERFWQRRGLARVFITDRVTDIPEKVFATEAYVDHKSFDTNLLRSGPLRAWAKGVGKEVFSDLRRFWEPLSHSKREEDHKILLQDPLGNWYETSLFQKNEASLFYSPAQLLGLLLQAAEGDLSLISRLRKEMFEFSS